MCDEKLIEDGVVVIQYQNDEVRSRTFHEKSLAWHPNTNKSIR
jgi:hypothetical protein